jgi:hypothetical protein
MRLPCLAAAALLLTAPAATGQPRTAPGRVVAAEQVARCEAVAETVRRSHLHEVRETFAAFLPAARDILRAHAVEARITDGGRTARVELHLHAIRDMDVPDDVPPMRYLETVNAARILQDPRSRIASLWELDEITVAAAARAYDIRYADLAGPDPHPWLEGEPLPALRDYEVLALYTDRYTGFAGLALAPRGGGRPAHRIYAIAGTHTLDHPDLRGWGSGLTFGRGQFVSNAALHMAADAADYARDMQGGGEVFITGQSQGGLTAQGLAYLTQAMLDEGAAPHHLVHMVSWGAIGAREVMHSMIGHWRSGEGRRFGPALERHWAISDPHQPRAADAWDRLTRRWARLSPGAEEAHLDETAARIRAIGFFFDLDLFSRLGTFFGTTFAFPTALVLPDACEEIQAEFIMGQSSGRFGLRLEAHFLRGYHRAVGRGALAVARPAEPPKWAVLTSMIPALESLGDLWMETVYFASVASSPANWARCRAAHGWMTQRNALCREDWWNGCAPDPDPAQPNWCLATEAWPGTVVREIR